MSQHSDFLQALWGDMSNGHILLWFHDGDRIKESFWFGNADDAAAFIDKVQDQGRHVNCYMGVGLAPRAYEINQRCLKKDIAGIPGLWLDIDIRCAEHKKGSLPANITEAMTLISDMPNNTEPTIIINSGHGLQAWWLFKEPWMFDSATERADAEQIARRFNVYFKNAAAAKGWDVDSTFNLDRVMRVPGTTNYKGKPVPVETIKQDDIVRYNPSDFEEWLPEIAKEQVAQDKPGAVLILDPQANPPFDRFQDIMDLEPKFKLSWDRQREFQDQSASSYDLSLARFAYMYGWNDQEVCNLLIAFRRKHGEDLKLRQDYYQRTLAIARRGIEQHQAQETIDAHVQAADPEDRTSLDGNAKESMLQSLSAIFGVTLIQIVKFVADPPIYKVKTNRGDITLGEVDNLIGQAKLRTHLAAATGKYLPKFKGPRWDNIAQALLDCCYEVEIGDEATEAGEMASWLQQYLDVKKPYTEDDIGEAVMNRMPVWYKSRVAIFGDDLRRWLKTAQQERINAKRMGLMLRAVGCEPDKLPMGSGSKRTSRSVWFLPKTMTEGEA